MAFKRGSVFYTELRVGDFRLPRTSTGMTDKRSAEEVEQALRMAWRWGHQDLLKRVANREVTLPEVWRAYCAPDPQATLAALARDGSDPELTNEVEHMKEVVTDERVRTGLDMLLEYAPDGARLSWLRHAPNVSDIYRKAEAAGRSSGTVRRTVHRAISDLLSERVGRGTMLSVLADAKIPAPSGTRTEILTRQQIRGLVYGTDNARGADVEFRPVLALGLLTGIDRGPLLRMRVADYDDDKRHLWVRDRKTHARPRYLPLEEGMAAWVRLLIAGKPPEAELTRLTESMLRGRWEALREAHQIKSLRWKDLRGVFATWAYQCGWDPLRIQRWLGHASPVMTQRYIKKVELLPREPRDITEAMGLTQLG